MIFRRPLKISPESIQAKVWPEITNTRCVTVNCRAIIRKTYVKHYGEIPINKKCKILRKLCVCHKCDNIYCANPLHLFLGNYSENMVDAIKKQRFKLFGLPYVKAKPKIDKPIDSRGGWNRGKFLTLEHRHNLSLANKKRYQKARNLLEEKP